MNAFIHSFSDDSPLLRVLILAYYTWTQTTEEPGQIPAKSHNVHTYGGGGISCRLLMPIFFMFLFNCYQQYMPPAVHERTRTSFGIQVTSAIIWASMGCIIVYHYTIHTGNNNNNNRRLVTLAEHTSDHGRQTNSSTEEKGEQVEKHTGTWYYPGTG